MSEIKSDSPSCSSSSSSSSTSSPQSSKSRTKAKKSSNEDIFNLDSIRFDKSRADDATGEKLEETRVHRRRSNTSDNDSTDSDDTSSSKRNKSKKKKKRRQTDNDAESIDDRRHKRSASATSASSTNWTKTDRRNHDERGDRAINSVTKRKRSSSRSGGYRIRTPSPTRGTSSSLAAVSRRRASDTSRMEFDRPPRHRSPLSYNSYRRPYSSYSHRHYDYFENRQSHNRHHHSYYNRSYRSRSRSFSPNRSRGRRREDLSRSPDRGYQKRSKWSPERPILSSIRTPPLPSSPDRPQDEISSEHKILNQYNEITSSSDNKINREVSSSQNECWDDDKPRNSKDPLYPIEPLQQDRRQSDVDPEDLAAMKTKVKQQLEEKLFHEKLSDIKPSSPCETGIKSNDLNHSGSSKESNSSKKTKKHKKKDKEKRRLEKLEAKRNKLLVRRSERIQHIEVERQYKKEMQIAEKIKKLTGSGGSKDFLLDQSSNHSEASRLDVAERRTTTDKSPLGPDSPDMDSSMVNRPTGYIHIDKNEYTKRTKRVRRELLLRRRSESRLMICDCTTSEQERENGLVPCGDECLNRMLLIECGKRCQCGTFCTNKNFKRRVRAPIEPFLTELKGWGVRALQDLKANSFLIEYVGEVIDIKEFKRRCEKYSEQNNQHFYFMSLQNDLFLDATQKGNMSRFFNHSCDPNCETQKWTVNGELRIGFFTRRPVQPNEELTFDYQFQTVGKKSQKCYCGSQNCRGFLGASSNNNQPNSSNGGVSGTLKAIWASNNNTDESDASSDELSTSSGESDHEKPSEKRRNSLKGDQSTSKTVDQSEDSDLMRQISQISSLSTKDSVLKLCQLMFRSESIESQLSILNLLLAPTNTETSLKLFMDYHGLKLLWSWMIDLDSNELAASVDDCFSTRNRLECKFKCLELLGKLAIKNRSTIDEYKLLHLVKKWSSSKSTPLTVNSEAAVCFAKSRLDQTMIDSSLVKETEASEWIRQGLINLVDDIECYHQETEACVDLNMRLKKKAMELNEEWSQLKHSFKIPKRQQIEERREHERELNELQTQQPHTTTHQANSYTPTGTPKSSRFSASSSSFFNATHPKHLTRPYRPNSVGQQSAFIPDSHIHNSQSTTATPNSLTKEQRRQLFEQKVKEDEEAAARLLAQQQHQLLKDPSLTSPLTAASSNPTTSEWIYDHQNNRWIQHQTPVPSHFYNNQQLAQPPYTTPPQLMEHQHQRSSNHSPLSQAHSSSSHQFLSNVPLSESHLQDLRQLVKQFHPASPRAVAPTSTDPKITDDGRKQQHQLPPHWSIQHNKAGRVYYFNARTKQSQWEFPKESGFSPNKVYSASLTNNRAGAVSPTSKIVNMVAAASQLLSTDTNHIDQVETNHHQIEDDDDYLRSKVREEIKSPTPPNAFTVNKPSESDKSSPLQASSLAISSDASTGEALKQAKEQLRDSISQMVVRILQVYMRAECKIGRVSDKNDFKFLARKFTHTILDKEMSRTTSLAGLSHLSTTDSKRIRAKTEEFIKRYMSKFGAEYSRQQDEQMSNNSTALK